MKKRAPINTSGSKLTSNESQLVALPGDSYLTLTAASSSGATPRPMSVSVTGTLPSRRETVAVSSPFSSTRNSSSRTTTVSTSPAVIFAANCVRLIWLGASPGR